MANVTQKTEPITPEQFHALASTLATMADVLLQAADVAKQQESGVLAVYNWPSVQEGRRRLKAFVDDASEAVTLAQLGTPREVGQLKPRSAGRKNALAEGHAKRKQENTPSRHISELGKSRKPKGKNENER